jgi:hypothetical protein
MMMKKLSLVLALLASLAILSGCAGMGGGGMTVRQGSMKSTLMDLQPCTNPAGCAQGVTYGRGIWGTQLKYVLHQQPTRNGYVESRVAVNGASQGLVNTLAPVALSAWGGWQAAALHASAVKYAAKNNNGNIQIYNSGGDATALQQTGVDVVQNPRDPDVEIDETHLYPEPPGN